MKRSRMAVCNLAVALVFAGAIWAQAPDSGDDAEAVEAQAAETPAPDTGDEKSPRHRRRDADQVRFGSSLEVKPGDFVKDAVVIKGSATINGTVSGDLVVLAGPLELGPTAVVEGDAAVVAGAVTILPGAVVEGDFAVVGSDFDAPPDFSAGGELVVVGAYGIKSLAPALDWLGDGPGSGRPLAPEFLWTWIWIAVFAGLYLATNAIFERPVRDVASALQAKPLTCFLVGGLVVLLIAPVSLLLVLSVVGIPAVPLLVFAVLLAAFLGKVGVARWIGGRVKAEDLPGDRAAAARSVVIGFLIVSVVYLVPVLGGLAWVVLSVLALGAATTTAAAGLRRENPRPAGPPASPPQAGSTGGNDQGPAPDSAAIGGEGQSDEASGAAAAPLAGSPPGSPSLASFPARVGAVALDFVPFAILSGVLDSGILLAALAFLVYSSAMWAWRGTTVGGMICHIRLVRTDGRDLEVGDGIVRGMASIISVAFVGLGWLWAAFDEKRQSWHDRAAGTYVVYADA